MTGEKDVRWLDDKVAVAGQLRAEDMAALKAAGFVAVINNRPDGEEPGQPAGADVAAAAEAARLTYRTVPIAGGFALPDVDAMADALDDADGPVLAFCRSGTRSAHLWALARARRGETAAPLVEAARGAGYDLAGLEPTLKRLSGE